MQIRCQAVEGLMMQFSTAMSTGSTETRWRVSQAIPHAPAAYAENVGVSTEVTRTLTIPSSHLWCSDHTMELWMNRLRMPELRPIQAASFHVAVYSAQGESDDEMVHRWVASKSESHSRRPEHPRTLGSWGDCQFRAGAAGYTDASNSRVSRRVR